MPLPTINLCKVLEKMLQHAGQFCHRVWLIMSQKWKLNPKLNVNSRKWIRGKWLINYIPWGLVEHLNLLVPHRTWIAQFYARSCKAQNDKALWSSTGNIMSLCIFLSMHLNMQHCTNGRTVTVHRAFLYLKV